MTATPASAVLKTTEERKSPEKRPLLLDLYCGAGGAGFGYHLAGFDVIGVDKEPQEHYPFPFIEADALKTLDALLAGGTVLDMAGAWRGCREHLVAWPCREAGDLGSLMLADLSACHSSPPCQFATIYNNNREHVRTDHPNLIPATRERLLATGLPYIIENVPRARPWLRDPVQLCGTSFGIEVRRHRLFESNVALEAPPCDHGRFTARKYPGSSNRPNGRTVCNVGEYRVPLRLQQEAMQIPWMSLAEIAQAIPPAMTLELGFQLVRHLEKTA
jgi:DNA (cytosine-5)-methyltransferase 1